MLKFESEFKINNKWEIGELVNIDIENHKYYIKVQKNQDETKIIEYDNKVLTCLNQNAPISKEEKHKVILEHFELLLKEKGEYTATREIRKHISWYVKGMPNATAIRDKINSVETQKEFIEILEQFFL